MRTLTCLIVSLVALACGAEGHPDGTSHGHESTTTGTTGPAATEAAETHASHASHSDDSGTTAAASETGHEHPTGTTDDHHGSEHGSEAGHETEAGAATPAAYCECMLVNCHDQYHGTWGEEHPASETMCAAAAEALPSVGMPAESGNSLECRYHYCQIGHDDPSACDSAIGGGACA